MINYDSLNPMQQKAVDIKEGSLLILAGAGSGKTGTITVRMADMIESGIRPWNILAITFTNKAAKEMRDRVGTLIGNQADSMWVTTFHSCCVKILRRDIDKLGFDRDFSIYDTKDSEKVMKDVFTRLSFSLQDKTFPLKSVMAQISRAKEELISPSQYGEKAEGDYRKSKVASCYREYQKRLKANNALDFDDLIYMTVLLFQLKPEVLEHYQERFKYIMVDEYQDTNTSQYIFVKLLANKYGNLCVVGDDDQSIYGWRGANIRNILDFEKDFPNTQIIKLEQNYRSTKNILTAANAVISNNTQRKVKELWTDNQKGNVIHIHKANNEYDEGRYIVEKIDEIVSDGSDYKDCAVLYRTNAQSRALEEALIRKSTPYHIYGGTRFYDRKEIMDIVAYLKFMVNPADDIAFNRIVNVPRRGIGDTTVKKIADYAVDNNLAISDVLEKLEEIPGLGTRGKKVEEFSKLIKDLNIEKDIMPIHEFIGHLTQKIGYYDMLSEEGTIEAETRRENIEEFISKAAEYVESFEDATISSFLEEIALVADVDSYTEGENAVVLMTLHSAKGLEFPYVFISGAEEGIFPSYRSIISEEEKDLQEERRLCYVGITRAKEELYITHTVSRMHNGQTSYNSPSRFINELPEELIDRQVKNKAFNYTEKMGLNSFKNAYDIFNKTYGKSNLSPKDFTLTFEVGDNIRAPKYGVGTVKSINPAGADYEVEVYFKDKGSKKFMAKLSKLVKVDV